MQELYFLGQIVLAALLGGILGWQRERWGKSAGPRTYALVTVGATLFTILSLHAFAVGQTAPVAAQIVTGIGFLGAGIIFHRESKTEGLTTAAGLWASAALGMAVGAEYYILSVGATVVMLILFIIDDRRFKKTALSDSSSLSI